MSTAINKEMERLEKMILRKREEIKQHEEMKEVLKKMIK